MSKNIISNNSDFLFLFDATQSNPNGDIDQENKPRMDYDTDTNLCSDTRVKRTIRDYLRHVKNLDIFVDMEGENKVSPNSKLEAVLNRLLSNELDVNIVFEENKEAINSFLKAKSEKPKSDELFKYLQGKKANKYDPPLPEVNRNLLAHLVKEKFIDIRFFGSAFAIGGFTKSYIGPIQLNWGYSLHKVKIMDSNSIVTIMNDDSSTIGKDYRVHYSLLAFNGTINKYTAKSTELTGEDVQAFREAIWSSVAALPTRSKINQYPKLYVEIIYNEGYSNGQFGDLRQYIKVIPKVDENAIRHYDDLTLDFTPLKNLISENKGSIIKDVIIRTPTGNTL